MGTTPHRRPAPSPPPAAPAIAAPAQARTTPSRMPVSATRAVLDPPATAVTPLGAATTAAGAGPGPVTARGRRLGIRPRCAKVSPCPPRPAHHRHPRRHRPGRRRAARPGHRPTGECGHECRAGSAGHHPGQPRAGEGQVFPAAHRHGPGQGRAAAQRRHGEVQLLQPHLARRPLAVAADPRPELRLRVGREHRRRPAHRRGRRHRVDEEHRAPQEHPQLLEQGHRRRRRPHSGSTYGIYWTQDFGTR